MTRVLATAMPTAKEPTMGERPTALQQYQLLRKMKQVLIAAPASLFNCGWYPVEDEKLSFIRVAFWYTIYPRITCQE